MDDYSLSVAKLLVGIVRVDISSLALQDDIEAREPDDTIVQYLIDVFNKSSNGCEPDEWENQVEAVISPSELDHVLQVSQLTRNDLRRSLLDGRYPKLKTTNKINFVHGRHRLIAGKSFLINSDPDNCWWTVRLYSFEPDNPYKETFLRKQSEQFSHQTKFSDGEVYRKVRHYQRLCREDLAQDWKIRLSKCKQSCLSTLLSHKDFVKAFDKLLPFPGLWGGLQLGNIKKDLALHCNEELIYYLQEHIYNTWNNITLGEPIIQQAVTIRDVQSLQSLAPSVSLIDRQHITLEMDRGVLFTTIVDGRFRQRIKQTLLQLPVIIPTIKTFHENVKYLGIGAKILKTQLLNGLVTTTLFRTMSSHWSLPENLVEEIREGEYQRVSLPEGESPIPILYLQVFIAALRRFASISHDSPRQEKLKRKRNEDPSIEIIRGSIVPTYKLRFIKLAQLSGFRTENIVEGLMNDSDLLEDVGPPAEYNTGETKERRRGIPYTKAYKQFPTQLFLRNLSQAQTEMSLNPSVLFVQQDFFNAFFGWTHSSGQVFAPSILLNPLSEQVVPENVHPVPDAAFIEQQPEIQPSPSLPELRLSLVASSESTSVISPQVLAYMESSECWSQPSHSTLRESDVERIERWSQFSLPILDENDSEGEQNERCNRREGSFASLLDHRRLLPAPELIDSERRSFPAVDMQDIENLSPAAEISENRPFPKLKIGSRKIDDRQSFSASELRDGNDRHRSFSTANLQGADIWTPTITDNSGCRSFPALELLDEEEFHFSPALDSGNDILDENRMVESASDLIERRSFPALEQTIGENERHSFEADASKHHRLQAAIKIRNTDRGAAVNHEQPQSLSFVEYNGMRKIAKSTSNMEEYLQQRQGWTMMVLRYHVLKTIRFDSIVEYMRRQEMDKFFLIAPNYAEHFRINHLSSISYI